jgi:hypothetical protein
MQNLMKLIKVISETYVDNFYFFYFIVVILIYFLLLINFILGV